MLLPEDCCCMLLPEDRDVLESVSRTYALRATQVGSAMRS